MYVCQILIRLWDRIPGHVSSVVILLLLGGLNPVVDAQTVQNNGSCAGISSETFSRRTVARSLVEGLPLYTSNRSTLRISSHSIGFFDKLKVGDKRSNRILVQNESGSVCGWTDESFVIQQSDNPLKVTDVKSGGRELRMTMQNGRPITNPLYAKALLRSNVRGSLAAQDYDALRVQLYRSPIDSSQKGDRVGVFTIYRIYKAHTHNGEKWYYVGGDRRLSQTFAGWVHEDNIFIWPTQMSLYYSPNSSSAIVFPDEPTMREGKVTDNLEFYGERPTDWDGGVGDVNTAKFPVLRTMAENANLQYLQIAFFGGDALVQSDNQTSDTGRVASRKIMEDMSKLGAISEDVTNADILFVIDNTQSMQRYFPYVARAVENAAQTIEDNSKKFNKQDESRFRFAAAVYGDYYTSSSAPAGSRTHANSKQMEFRFVTNFTTQASDLRGLTRVPVFTDPLDDGYEASRAGLIRAMDEAGFSKDDDRSRYVIWIGDYGSRSYNNNEKLRDSSVTDALKKHDAIFYAIAVKGGSSSGYRSFLRQARNISQLDRPLARRDKGFGSVTPKDLASNSRGPEATAGAVKQALIDLFSETHRAKVEITEAGGGTRNQEDAEFINQLPSSNLELREAIFRSKGYTREEVQRIFSAGQIMRPGYVAYDENAKNFQVWINMELAQATLHYDAMDRICRGLQSSNAERYFRDALLQITEGYSGDERPYSDRETITEFLARHMFLPVNNYPEMLNMTLPDLLNEWDEATAEDDARKIRSIAGPICSSAELFGHVTRGEYIDARNIRSLDDYGFEWEVRRGYTAKPFRWKWVQRNGNNYVYIPGEYFQGRSN